MMKYPGRIIKMGESDARIVKALKSALNKALVLVSGEAILLDAFNPSFGLRMKQAVQLFQARNFDDQQQPLKIDGQVGALTWAALFGNKRVPQVDTVDNAFLSRVLAIAGAAADKKIREQPQNSNRGPQVDEYMRRTGATPGLAWCCVFTYWCFDEAAKKAGQSNPMYQTAGCLVHWNKAMKQGALRILAKDVLGNPELVKPGMVFIMDFGGGLGHTGFVEQLEGGYIHTIEGNTDASQTREGGGVYRLKRKINSVNKGFIDYAGT
jgi:CHAP domain